MDGATFLLVDDVQADLFALEQLVRAEVPDCKVLTASDPRRAVDLARQHPIDVALVDVRMPNRDGIQVCRDLKASEDTAHIPVVLVTAPETEPRLRAEGLDAGAADFLAKPIDRVELAAKIRVMLRFKQDEDELRRLNAELEQRVYERTRALQENEERFRMAVLAAPMAIMIHAEGGKVLQVNKVWTELTGYTLGDLPTYSAWAQKAYLLKPVEEPITSPGRNAWEAQAHDGERKIRTKTGEERIWDIRSSPVGGLPDGRRLMVTVATDVTAQQQVEAALRRENAKLGTMLSGIDGGVIFVDADNVVVEINDWFLRLIRQPRQTVVGRRVDDLPELRALKPLLGSPERLRARAAGEAEVIHQTVGGTEVFLRLQPIHREDRYEGALVSVTDVTETVQAKRKLEETNRRLEEQAATDELTGLPNRRRFLEVLRHEFEQTRRYGTSLVLAVVDVDRFKNINDVYGHAFGDRVLREVAKMLQACVRTVDTVARHGGDEFEILMPQTEIQDAFSTAERIRREIAQLPISDGVEVLQVTVSIGIGSAAGSADRTPDNLVQRADEALYAAKGAGRDCTRAWPLDCDHRPDEAPLEQEAVERLQQHIEGLASRSLEMFIQSVQNLVRAIEAHDPNTRGHSEKVAGYAVGIAETLGLADEDADAIRRAGMVHDIGKVGISDALLRKPERLTPEEHRLVEQHVLIGASILDRFGALDRAIPIVRYHHERWDGQGYPDGLRGEAIPLGARVLAVADVFDALTSDRAYHRARDEAATLEILEQEAGRQFDPAAVEALVRWLRESGPLCEISPQADPPSLKHAARAGGEPRRASAGCCAGAAPCQAETKA
jgi:diguanylate cyclase (GGDEF)-like protein/PAS domain S-box-containing protein/putative nucleotidyltransferase with HDIG domain